MKRAARDCGIEGCENPHQARGFCNLHYARELRTNGPFEKLPHHILSDVDTEAMTATCRVCGPAAKVRLVTGRIVCDIKTVAVRRERRQQQVGTEAYNAYHRAYRRRRVMGAGSNDAVRLALEASAYQCELCAAKLTWSTARFDHDHSCCVTAYTACGNCFRGILCNSCNTALGAFKDDPQLLRDAADYLDRALMEQRRKATG